MAINQDTVVPKVVAAALLRQYYQDRVYAARVNNTWRNMLNPYGDSVIINRPRTGTDPSTIRDYQTTNLGPQRGNMDSVGDRESNITYDTADVGEPLVLSMDKVKYWAVEFDDLDRAISRIDLLQESIREFGINLANVVDADVRTKQIAGATNIGATAIPGNSSTATEHLSDGIWASAGTAWTKTALDALSIEDLELDTVHRIMDFQNMPKMGRWAIVNPLFGQALRRIALKQERILVSPGTPAGQLAANGLMGSFGGFTWYVDSGNYAAPSAPTGNPAVSSSTQAILFGNDTAVAFIDQIRKQERLRLQTRFSDAVRGLYKYGAMNVYPRRIFAANFTVTGLKPGLFAAPLQETGTATRLPANTARPSRKADGTNA